MPPSVIRAEAFVTRTRAVVRIMRSGWASIRDAWANGSSGRSRIRHTAASKPFFGLSRFPEIDFLESHQFYQAAAVLRAPSNAEPISSRVAPLRCVSSSLLRLSQFRRLSGWLESCLRPPGPRARPHFDGFYRCANAPRPVHRAIFAPLRSASPQRLCRTGLFPSHVRLVCAAPPTASSSCSARRRRISASSRSQRAPSPLLRRRLCSVGHSVAIFAVCRLAGLSTGFASGRCRATEPKMEPAKNDGFADTTTTPLR